MIELDTLYNEDCLEGMKRIPDGSVDCVICDLPYGTMKGAALNGWHSDQTEWDECIPTKPTLRGIRASPAIRRYCCALFSQEPYTSSPADIQGIQCYEVLLSDDVEEEGYRQMHYLQRRTQS